MTALLTELAPAKINLTLEVLGRRSDGYHEIRSLVVFAHDIADVITLDPSQTTRLTVGGPAAAAITSTNLAATALAALQHAAPDMPIGALRLEKKLPVAAGIGGGSSDAAAVLRVVQRCYPDVAAWRDISAMAESLGADVPVCYANRAVVMTGVGERLTAADVPTGLAAVLVNPGVEVPRDKTARVFKALAAPDFCPTPATSRELKIADLDMLLMHMSEHRNDLQAAAASVMPMIDIVLETLAKSKGCRFVRMSGAGPTCFGLYDTLGVAEAAAHAIQNRRPAWWTKAARLN